jgi:hypothetical protein
VTGEREDPPPVGLVRPAVEPGLTATVLDFRPSRHGFHFANRFPPGPTLRFGPVDTRWLGVGDASAGLCGGMAATVRDLFEARLEPPPDREPPANGSRRFDALVRRQVQTLDWLRVPLRFYDLSAFRPDPPTAVSRLARRRPARELTLSDEWPRIRAEIDAGGLAMVGLVRQASANPFGLTSNHQVLAYGYRVERGLAALRLYDPNHPDRDDVEARILLDGAGRPVRLQSVPDEPLVGFFLAPYRWEAPRAWR